MKDREKVRISSLRWMMLTWTWGIWVYKDGEEEFGMGKTGHLTQWAPRPNLKSSRPKEDDDDDDDDAFNQSVTDTVLFKNKLFFLSCFPPQTEELGPSCCGLPHCITLGTISAHRPARLNDFYCFIQFSKHSWINMVTLTMVTPLHVLSNIHNTQTIKAITH